jgi:serine/threonine protein kinase
VFKADVYGFTAAIKVFNETGGEWDDKQIQTEIDYLCRVCHPHINKLLAVSFNGPQRCLVLEHMNGGALDDRLRSTSLPALQWHERAKILIHVARGLVYMHSLNPPVVHRDVKCGNVLLQTVKNTASQEETLVAKVSDFGKLNAVVM